MNDDMLDVLENLKGRTVVDVVMGDIESEQSFSQMAVVRLDNDKQLTITSHSLLKEEEQLVEPEEGLSGLSAVYGELDEFWKDVEGEKED